MCVITYTKRQKETACPGFSMQVLFEIVSKTWAHCNCNGTFYPIDKYSARPSVEVLDLWYELPVCFLSLCGTIPNEINRHFFPYLS